MTYIGDATVVVSRGVTGGLKVFLGCIVDRGIVDGEHCSMFGRFGAF